ncbi:MAG: hypothetical protein ACKVQU_35570 [Burkholderiales bacterium]
MNMIKATVFMMLLAVTAASSVALAQHRHHGPRVGVFIGGPLFWGHPHYYAPSYYYAPIPLVQPSPPVYIEQSPPPAVAASAPPPGYWYYCRESQGYYPYVKECPAPWERVAPQPSR